MAQKDLHAVGKELAVTIEKLKTHLELLDQRLDNIDSVVSALVERVMNQPLTISVRCPHCGKSTDINLIGNVKPGTKK